jgi:hypothetical protein
MAVGAGVGVGAAGVGEAVGVAGTDGVAPWVVDEPGVGPDGLPLGRSARPHPPASTATRARATIQREASDRAFTAPV